MTGENIEASSGGNFPVTEKLAAPAERLQIAITEDRRFQSFLEKTLTEYLPAIRALSGISPDLGVDFGALQELADQPPLELARRVLYKIGQETYTKWVKEHYAKVSASFMTKECPRKCSEWSGGLLLKYGPEEAKTMAGTKCLLKEYELPDEDLNLFVETAVHAYPKLFEEILGSEGKEFIPRPGRVVERFLKHGAYSLRKYFASHLNQWKEVLQAQPKESPSPTT